MLSAESARTGIFAFRDAEGLSGEWHESGQTGRTDPPISHRTSDVL